MIVLVLPSLLLISSGAENSASVISQSKSTITVLPTDTPKIDCESSGVLLHDLLVRNLQGEIIKETVRGSQVVLEATVTNYCDNLDNQLSITLFEVRDSNGLAIYLTWRNEMISSSQERPLGSSWLAYAEPGDYTVRAFHISNLHSTQVLSDVKRYELKVLP